MIRQIQYFQAVVRCKNFTEAAEECFISQSAISQQIAALEKELGVKLLKRVGRKFSLTPAGEYFYRKSLVLIGDFERIRREVTRIGHGTERTLAIGYLRSLRGSEFKRAIADYNTKHPDVSIELISGTHEELYEGLRDGKVILAFSDLRRNPSSQYVNFPIAKSCFYAGFPISSPFARLPALTMEELKNTPGILISSPEQEKNEEEFYREYLGAKSEFLFTESTEKARLMAVSGKGWILVDFPSPPENTETLAFVPLFRGEERLVREYYAFWRVENNESYIEDFAEILKAQYEKL